ncbi:MAG TPA: ABC transporter permease [Myxococcaceae bacterium]|jgi:predicted permease
MNGRLTELRDDLRFAIRLLRKNPGFTVVAVLTLALAIGANTAIFSVVNGVLLRPLPFEQPERLFWVVRRGTDGSTFSLSVPQTVFLAAQPRPFEQITAFPATTSGFNLNEGNAPEHVLGTQVMWNFFEVFGVPPMMGRGFLPEEDRPDGPRVVVLSHEMWQRRFGGVPDMVGRSIRLNGESHTVVGVAPPEFRYPEEVQLWAPLRLDMNTTATMHYLLVTGRLRPGVDPKQVSALLKEQGELMQARHPEIFRQGFVLEASPLHGAIAASARSALLVLLGAVGLLLLIACVNLANLQLARATAREWELALRTALGASPGRLTRQLLTESVLLSGVGGGLGLILAAVSLPGLLGLASEQLPLREAVRVDGVVLAFTFGLSVLAGLLFGVLPAWQAARLAPAGSLQVSTSRATQGRAGSRTRRVLVVCQVALAVVLLIGAGLLVKSFAMLQGVEPGFDPEGVLTMRLSLPRERYGSLKAFDTFVQRVVARGRALPGVEALGFAMTLPTEMGPGIDFRIHGSPQNKGSDRLGAAYYRPVTGGYFKALRLELVRGRLLDDLDHYGTARVVVISEAAAQRFWPGGDPIGQRVTLAVSSPAITDVEPREIIGVVKNVRERGLHIEPPAILYVPASQVGPVFHELYVGLVPQKLVIRGTGDPKELAEAMQQVIREVDPEQPVTNALPMSQLLARSLGAQRFNTLLMGLMAALALILAAMGIYGVLSYLVNQRTQEMGVRMAMGATRAQVVWLVLRQGLATVGMGLALGMLGALWFTHLLSSLLFYVSELDPVAFAAAPIILLVVALVAILVPALRASRVDPIVALRAE